MSPKQQRRPLPSLLSLSFFYGIYCTVQYTFLKTLYLLPFFSSFLKASYMKVKTILYTCSLPCTDHHLSFPSTILFWEYEDDICQACLPCTDHHLFVPSTILFRECEDDNVHTGLPCTVLPLSFPSAILF